MESPWTTWPPRRGVGKGTLFRRFGSRSGLMIVLLDEDEMIEQQAFMFGPPPGPRRTPLERLLAYGRSRLEFVHVHHALLSDAARDPTPDSTHPPTCTAPMSGCCSKMPEPQVILDAQADALTALLDADRVAHELTDRGKTLDELGDAWETVARKLCGDVSGWILHVDLDQFLASVELQRHPELVGLPVIVDGSGDPTEARKVVTCASYEAREFGVHAGMPLRIAACKCPDATFLPSDPQAYDEASERVMGLLRDLGHPLEVWGWDEAYLGADVADPVALADRIRTVVAAETGLSCSVGISDNKQRAKVATGFGKPAGIFVLTGGQLDGADGRPPRRRALGCGPQNREKACGHGYPNRRRPRRHRCHHPDRGLRPQHRAGDSPAGQGRWRHRGQLATLGCRGRAAMW